MRRGQLRQPENELEEQKMPELAGDCHCGAVRYTSNAHAPLLVARHLGHAHFSQQLPYRR